MQNVKPGDVLLYKTAIRENGRLSHYYACEVVGSISGGQPLALSGEPITGVRAIYRRENVTLALPPRRILLARHENEPDEQLLLSRELEQIFGPGALITGVPCHCESACSMLKKRL